MTPLLLTISSGTGPREARDFVRRLSDALACELIRRGALVESTRIHGKSARSRTDRTEARSADDRSVGGRAVRCIHGPIEAPSSIDLAVLAERAWLSDLIGTHALVMRSEQRSKRDRKRWYVGVCCVDRDDTRASKLDVRDVRFETCRASGAGGQHVNKTESAVRAHHRPSGLSVRIESERSQHRNKQRALEELARMLAHRADTVRARTESSRRARSLQVERGAAVMTWCLEGDELVRAEGSRAVERCHGA